jgi:hypothetical protein
VVFARVGSARRHARRVANVSTETFNRRAGAVAQAMNEAFRQSTAGATSGTFPCPKCGSQVRFTALIPHKSSGQCAAAGCIRWSAQ